MSEQIIWTIEVERGEAFPVKLYLDEKSAIVSLKEHFTEYWIQQGWAKVKAITAVSYFT